MGDAFAARFATVRSDLGPPSGPRLQEWGLGATAAPGADLRYAAEAS